MVQGLIVGFIVFLVSTVLPPSRSTIPRHLGQNSHAYESLCRNCPATYGYVEIDFNRQNLAEVLDRNEFDRGQPTIFVWEGVTNYLSDEAVDAVLCYVGGCAPGTRVAFTYVHRDAIDGSARFADATRIISNVAELGERWSFGFVPEELPSYLRERGLRLDRDDDARQYRRAYFGKTADSMNGYDFYHVAVASVPGRIRASPD